MRKKIVLKEIARSRTGYRIYTLRDGTYPGLADSNFCWVKNAVGKIIHRFDITPAVKQKNLSVIVKIQNLKAIIYENTTLPTAGRTGGKR